MEIDKKWLSKVANEEGFVRNTLEKVCRLREVLLFINTHPLMRECLALKGGTAINLTIFNLPRLSVDIDLDYSREVDRETMQLEDSEKRFLKSFEQKKYHPEYLFEDPDTVKRIINHPMAIWKMQNSE